MLNFTLSHTPNGIETRTLSIKDGNLVYELNREDNTPLTDTTYCIDMLNVMLGHKINKDLIKVLTDIFTAPTLNTREMYIIVQLINSILTTDTSMEIKPMRKSEMYLGHNLNTSEDFVLDYINNSTTLIQGKSGSGKTYLLARMFSNYFKDERKENITVHLACSKHSTLRNDLRIHYQVSNMAYFEEVLEMVHFVKYIEDSIDIRQKHLEQLGYGSYEQYLQGEKLMSRPITITPLLIVIDDLKIYYDKLNKGNHLVEKLDLDRLLLSLQRTGHDLGIHMILTSQNFEQSNIPKQVIIEAEQFFGLGTSNQPYIDNSKGELENELGTAWYSQKEKPDIVQKISIND